MAEIDSRKRSGLMGFLRTNYGRIMIMKNSGLTSKSIVDYINRRHASGPNRSLERPVTVVHFNKAWREVCMKNKVPMKPDMELMKRIRDDIEQHDERSSTTVKAESSKAVLATGGDSKAATEIAAFIRLLIEAILEGTRTAGEQRELVERKEPVKQSNEVVSSAQRTDPPKPLAEIEKSRLSSFLD